LQLPIPKLGLSVIQLVPELGGRIRGCTLIRLEFLGGHRKVVASPGQRPWRARVDRDTELRSWGVLDYSAGCKRRWESLFLQLALLFSHDDQRDGSLPPWSSRYDVESQLGILKNSHPNFWMGGRGVSMGELHMMIWILYPKPRSMIWILYQIPLPYSATLDRTRYENYEMKPLLEEKAMKNALASLSGCRRFFSLKPLSGRNHPVITGFPSWV